MRVLLSLLLFKLLILDLNVNSSTNELTDQEIGFCLNKSMGLFEQINCVAEKLMSKNTSTVLNKKNLYHRAKKIILNYEQEQLERRYIKIKDKFNRYCKSEEFSSSVKNYDQLLLNCTSLQFELNKIERYFSSKKSSKKLKRLKIVENKIKINKMDYDYYIRKIEKDLIPLN